MPLSFKPYLSRKNYQIQLKNLFWIEHSILDDKVVKKPMDMHFCMASCQETHKQCGVQCLTAMVPPQWIITQPLLVFIMLQWILSWFQNPSSLITQLLKTSGDLTLWYAVPHTDYCFQIECTDIYQKKAKHSASKKKKKKPRAPISTEAWLHSDLFNYQVSLSFNCLN